MTRNVAMHARGTEAGFSLVELMVALVLGLILTSGVISVYLTSKKTYTVNNALGQVIQHGRFSLSLMDPQIRLAGFKGCRRTPTISDTSNSIDANATPDVIYSLDKGNIYGFEANGTGINGSLDINSAPTIETTPPNDASLWTPALDSYGTTLFDALKGTATGAVLKGSDIFVVHEMQSNPTPLGNPIYTDPLVDFTTTSSRKLNMTDTSSFSVGQAAVVSDCLGNSFIFSVSAVASNSSITMNTPSASSVYAYSAKNGGFASPLLTYVYYVGKGADGHPSLYQGRLESDGTFKTNELASGVENMQVLYGVDTTGDYVPDNFETADQVDTGQTSHPGLPAWDKVVSIKVALVVESDDNAVENAPATALFYYMLASDPAGNLNSDGMKLTVPIDRRLRKYFSQTFSVRNSLQ